MNNLSYKLNKLSRKYKQTGGGGIPFSALQQGGKKTIRRKTRRSPSRKRRVSKKTSRRTKRRSNRNKIKRTSSKNKKKCDKLLKVAVNNLNRFNYQKNLMKHYNLVKSFLVVYP